AQPDPSDPNPLSDDTGVIWTCHDGTANVAPQYTYIAGCIKSLKVNGAFIAKQINLLRVNGDVAPAKTNEDGYRNALSSSNIAEVFNFSPDMVIGGPFF